jgi:hypothetical protein
MAEIKEKRLLREFKIFEANNIQEVDSEDGILRMEGIIQKANSPNANNRIYPKAILEREDHNMGDNIKHRACVGELDHPDTPIVQLENGSHILTKSWWNGDDLMGEIEILDTPKGRILESYIKRGVRLGISSRGLGSTSKTNEGYDMVEDDYQMITYDMVSNPSTNGAFMYLKESQEFHMMNEHNKSILLENIVDEILGL